MVYSLELAISVTWMGKLEDERQINGQETVKFLNTALETLSKLDVTFEIKYIFPMNNLNVLMFK